MLLLFHYILYTGTAVADTVVVVGAAVAIHVVLLVGSYFGANRRIYVDVAHRRSAAGDVDTCRVRYDAGGV